MWENKKELLQHRSTWSAKCDDGMMYIVKTHLFHFFSCTNKNMTKWVVRVEKWRKEQKNCHFCVGSTYQKTQPFSFFFQDKTVVWHSRTIFYLFMSLSVSYPPFHFSSFLLCWVLHSGKIGVMVCGDLRGQTGKKGGRRRQLWQCMCGQETYKHTWTSFLFWCYTKEDRIKSEKWFYKRGL